MDDTTKLLHAYQSMLELTREQWQIVSSLDFVERIEDFQNVEPAKAACQNTIEQIASNESLMDELSEIDRGNIISHIEQLQQLHANIQQKLLSAQESGMVEMKNMSHQRKTMQAYGGLNNSDVISYYFDEKQ